MDLKKKKKKLFKLINLMKLYVPRHMLIKGVACMA